MSEKSFHKPWRASVLTLFLSVNRHRTVDSPPSGGGPGMVLKPDVAAKAIDSLVTSDENSKKGRPLIYLTPRGKPLTQNRVRALAQGEGLIVSTSGS